MSQPRLTFWPLVLGWCAASIVGFGLATFLHFPGDFRSGLFRFEWPPALFGFALGAVSGLPAGGLQWLVLRRHVPHTLGWIGATALGVGVMHGLNDSMPATIAVEWWMLVSGLSIGVAQWWVLRPHLPQAGWWVLVSLTVWSIAWAVAFAVLKTSGLMALEWRPGLELQTHGLFALVFGAVYGLITGSALWVLVRQPVQAHNNATLPLVAK
jgi:hypothetical protein